MKPKPIHDETCQMTPEDVLRRPYPRPVRPEMADVSESEQDGTPNEPFLVRMGAKMGTTAQKTPWTPAFVAACGLIFVLASALVAVTLSWQSTKSDLGYTRRDLDKLSQQFENYKVDTDRELDSIDDYYRDAYDQLARDMNAPPLKRREKPKHATTTP